MCYKCKFTKNTFKYVDKIINYKNNRPILSTHLLTENKNNSIVLYSNMD